MKFEYEPSWDHTLDSFRARMNAHKRRIEYRHSVTGALQDRGPSKPMQGIRPSDATLDRWVKTMETFEGSVTAERFEETSDLFEEAKGG